MLQQMRIFITSYDQKNFVLIYQLFRGFIFDLAIRANSFTDIAKDFAKNF